MTEHLQRMIIEAQARFDSLSPMQQARHRYMQKRSFVRGMCPSKRDFAEYCAEVDKILPDEATLTDQEIAMKLAGV